MDGNPAQQVPDLGQFLRDSRKLGAEFNKELKKESMNVAKYVVQRAQSNASTEQERQVAKGLAAKSDRVPTIRMGKTNFVSSSRKNNRRTEASKAKRIDVFFGAEFGGRKYGKGNPTRPQANDKGRVRKGGGYTTQFRPHRGTRGYFFYPTVRQSGPKIVEMYADGVERVRRKWAKGRL